MHRNHYYNNSKNKMNLPICTLLILILNILVHILIFLFSWNLSNFSIATIPIFYYGEWYRIITSAFVHGGIFHIGMNMMSLCQLAPALENQFGSLQLFFVTSWIILIEGILYISIN